MTDTTSKHYLIKAPQSNTTFTLRCQPTDFYDIATKLYVDTQDSNLQTSITSLLTQTTQLNNEIVTINQNTLNNIPFSKINAYPSNNLNVIYGDGTIGKITNTQITDNTISWL